MDDDAPDPRASLVGRSMTRRGFAVVASAVAGITPGRSAPEASAPSRTGRRGSRTDRQTGRLNRGDGAGAGTLSASSGAGTCPDPEAGQAHFGQPCGGRGCMQERLRRNGETSVGSAAPPAYALLDLGMGDGTWGIATDVSDRGDVIWSWATLVDAGLLKTTDTHELLVRDGESIDLTALGMHGARFDLNGAVVGWDDASNALRYLSDTAAVEEFVPERPEVTPPEGYEQAFLGHCNASGLCAGTLWAHTGLIPGSRAYILNDGEITILGPSPGGNSSSAHGINASGVVAAGGTLYRYGVGHGRAFTYDPSTGLTVDLGRLPGYTSSNPTGNNDAGQVLGFVWQPEPGTEPLQRAFLHDPAFGMVDLGAITENADGWWVFAAAAINNSGVIVGQGVIDGERHGIVLTPAGT